MTKSFGAITLVILSAALSACEGAPAASQPGGAELGANPPAPAPTQTTTPPPGQAPVSTRKFTTDFMVFTGAGTWSTEIGDVEALLAAHGASYQEVNSAELDAMTPQDLGNFGVIYIPGGEGGTEAGSVSSATHANLRDAVQVLGVSYVGFCAGAFVAVAPAPAIGGDVSYGFGIVDGRILNDYSGPGTNNAYEMTLESFPDGSTQNILWYGGPVTPDTGVVAKYPTGEPAISEMWSGAGLVIIAGLHPDLSVSSLKSLGVSPSTSSQDTAWKILNGALTQQPLPTF